MPDPTVLVVEDDPVILRLLEVNFELEGFTVLLAHDGAEGIEVARANQPDVIISDIMMPKTSGLELVEVGQGADERPQDGAGSRRRRLRHQAVRAARPGRARERAALPIARRSS